MEPFNRFVAALLDADVRFVVIGVFGANFYAVRGPGSTSFTTKDQDLFLPPDVENEMRAWEVSERYGLELWCGNEPLGLPRDRWLAERIVERRMVVTVTDRVELNVDLSLTMGDLDFETVWSERRTFPTEGVPVPVARLAHIVESKRSAGREKDVLFLVTHEQALRDLLKRDD